MLELPTGTVTLLFTDIEGSTRLLRELGPRYAEVLAAHRRIVRDAVAAHGGREIDTQGDAFFVAFASAADAVAAAVAIQQGLADGPIRVRMGLHTGEPIWTGEGYIGLDVHLAARVCAAAHGGQAVLTEATRQLLDAEPAGAPMKTPLVDLGSHRLRDIPGSVQLFQLATETFPPLRTAQPSNLPVAPVRLIGREREVEALAARLANGDRWVTIVGPGGVGKTRLSLAVAAQLPPRFPDGVYLVDLTKIREPGLVVPSIAQAIGAGSTAAELIRDKRVLLVLDNFEHVLNGAADAARLLEECPRLAVLATSRTPVSVRAESTFDLSPLETDAAADLFTLRASALDPGFVRTDALAEICRRLDGLPLAVELAASRARVMSAEAMLKRLDRRLGLLTTGPRDLPDRQRTLRATIAWSVDLLEPPARAVFPRLAVFAGGWTLEAAEEVVGADLDALGQLVDQSLVRRSGERYTMLDTVREYATEELERSGELQAAGERHATYFVGLAESPDELPRGIHYDVTWARVCADEQGNFRLALEWLEQHGKGAELMTIAEALFKFWVKIGATEEAERWMAAAVELGADEPVERVALMFAAWGEFPRYAGDPARAIEIKQRGLELATDAAPDRRPTFLADLVSLALALGDRERARPWADEAYRLRVELGDRNGIAQAEVALGEVALADGNAEEAERVLRKSLETWIETSNTMQELETACYLAEAVRRQGRADEAQELFGEVARRSLEIDYQGNLMTALLGLARIVSERRPELAAELLEAAEEIRVRAHVAPYYVVGSPKALRQELEGHLGAAAVEAAAERGRSRRVEDLLASVSAAPVRRPA